MVAVKRDYGYTLWELEIHGLVVEAFRPYDGPSINITECYQKIVPITLRVGYPPFHGSIYPCSISWASVHFWAMNDSYVAPAAFAAIVCAAGAGGIARNAGLGGYAGAAAGEGAGGIPCCTGG